MNSIPLYVTDFIRFLRNERFKSEDYIHPTMYFETDRDIWFYKPIDGIIYSTHLEKDMLPTEISISGIKMEFQALEIQGRIVNNTEITLTGSITMPTRKQYDDIPSAYQGDIVRQEVY